VAKLKVVLRGQTISELDLQPGVVYFAGRSDQCQIVLPEERGISRQHIKIADEGGLWAASQVSRYGIITFNGQNVESVTLDNDMHFIVGPFEFFFEFQAASARTNENQVLEAEVVSAAPTSVTQDEVEVQDFAAKADDTSPGNFEATRAGVSNLVAYLKVFNHTSQTEEVLKLEGHLWTIGRSPSSEIYINDAAISRKHLELSHGAEGYFITDHNSSNGTELNGEMITPQVPHQIRSGDVINIKHIRITFEVRNIEFEKMVSNLPAVQESHYADEASDSSYHPTQIRSSLALSGDESYDDSGVKSPGVIKVDRPMGPQGWIKDRRVQIGLAFAALTMVWLFTNEPSQKSVEPSGQQELGSKKEVTGEQMSVVKEKYELAKKNYFERGNYTFCRDLLGEVHQIVPFFEDSKNLASLCEQSIELQLIRQEREDKEKKKIDAENKIRITVENCRSQMNGSITTMQMQECLAPALELDPGNTDAQVLIKQIEERDLRVRDEEINKKQYAQRLNQGRQHYSRANQLENSGRLRAALQEYNTFLQKNYPGLSDEEQKAQRSIASIRQSINQKVLEKVNICRNLVGQSHMKAGIKACDEALREDPQNADAIELKKTAQSQMKRELRSIYEDSRLEESMGNVENAKQKWKKIQEDSYPGEEFYEKAKNKLKKYEG
jgi:pSer/pThr/pTyr-binding forkhead associated (FHA) protein